MLYYNPFPNNKSSKLKEFADHNIKFAENGRKFSERIETLWEKKKLLVTSNFSFSHSVFKRPVLQTGKNQGLFEKGFTIYHTILTSHDFEKEPFENIVLKGENAGDQHFLLFL